MADGRQTSFVLLVKSRFGGPSQSGYIEDLVHMIKVSGTTA